VLGNCGVTFAPVRPGDREFLAEIMESVEDIPRAAILEGLPWDWSGYGEYLSWLDRIPKGLNVGGLVGHCAVRLAAMGERSLEAAAASADDIAAMVPLVEEAMASGALGFSTSRTMLHRVPDGRHVPGTWAAADELIAIGDVLGRFASGVFESVGRTGDDDSDDVEGARAELAWMGEVSRRSGQPVTFGLTQSERQPGLYSKVIGFAREENSRGANVRPQTTSRGVGILSGLAARTPFDRAPAWRALRHLSLDHKLAMLADPDHRADLVAAATMEPSRLDPADLYVLPPGPARYDVRPEDSLATHAALRGVTAVEAFIDLNIERGGRVLCNYPFLNQRLDAIEEMLDDPIVVMGLADAGAHVGQIMDSSQPTFFLTYWVRERGRWSLEEAVRRLTSDTATLFRLPDRGVLRPGAFADINAIDLDGLVLHQPAFVRDFSGGAGRYIQRADGYAYTLVNGEVFMDHGEHSGAFAGRLLRSTD
jgi:N-acyl-D-aspartate/D-glutamate deacylase